VEPIGTPIQELLRALTPDQHLWVNTQMNLMLQSRMNGATTPHKFIT